MSGDDPILLGPMSREDALALMRRRMSADDMRNLEAAPDGEAMVVLIADVLADESARLDRSITARHLIQRKSDVNSIATGGIVAETTLQIARVAGAPPIPVTFPVGTKVTTGAEATRPHVFLSQAAVTFAAGATSPQNMDVRAEIACYAATSIAGSITKFASVANATQGDRATVSVVAGVTYLQRTGGDLFTPDMAGLYVKFTDGANLGKYAQITSVLSTDQVVLTPAVDPLVAEALSATWEVQEWSDLGFVVTQPNDTTQGRDDDLDALAREANRQRRTGEMDATLLAELLHLVDAVEPTALVRAANRVLGIYGPVRIYETGAAPIDADPTLGLCPFPGLVVGRSPIGVAPDDAGLAAPAAVARAPVPGLAATAPLDAFFLVRWDGKGLGDPGAYIHDSTGVVTPDSKPPKGFAVGVSPVGGKAFGDAHIRKAIGAALNRIKGGGVTWRWYPRRFFGGV